MTIKKWENLPLSMRNSEVRYYYDIIRKKKNSLIMKRIFDVLFSSTLLIVSLPIFLFVSIIIKIDSDGTIFFKQTRVTQYGETFSIIKFRTMYDSAGDSGIQLAAVNDKRITKVGMKLRKYRIDEVPQLINILKGEMSFVGTRPEVIEYVKHYSDEMLATLLMPAGVTSEASIRYRNEAMLLEKYDYVTEILPQKMRYNLNAICEFSFMRDIKIILLTLTTIFSNKSLSELELKQKGRD